ncbi:O-antigen ligase [Agromyces sp. Marseille-P2726]|uniref:O-antigen ligase family protein n=1 Tax=Agromyces sp. Marseille-P2726 TaxID=2709132 RepID=UPI00156ED009|nr:O-antigen ligase family protein [Agromyces sp. Marseille-P2726]
MTEPGVSGIVLVVLAIATLIFLPLVASRLDRALVVLLVLSWANSVTIALGPANLRIEIFALVLAGVAALLDPRGIRKLGWFSILVAAAAAAWLVASAFASATAAEEPVRSYYMLGMLIAGVGAYFLVSGRVSDPVWVVRMGTSALAVLCGVCLLLLVTGLTGPPLLIPPQGGVLWRVRGLALEANLMGSICAGWLAVMFYWRRRLGRVHIVSAVVISLAAVLTNTRATWICLAVLGIALALTYRKHAVALLPLVLAIVIAVIAALPSNSEQESLLWKASNIFSAQDGTGLYRIRTWDIAFDDLNSANGWLTGLGVNSYPQRHPIDITNVTEGYVGNVWVSTIYDSGIIGLILFALMLVLMWLRSPDRLGALPLFATLGISFTFTNGFWMLFPWIYLALVSVGPKALIGPSDPAAGFFVPRLGNAVPQNEGFSSLRR